MKKDDKQPESPKKKPQKKRANKPLPKNKHPVHMPNVDLDLGAIARVMPSDATMQAAQRAAESAAKIFSAQDTQIQKIAVDFAKSLNMPYTQLELQRFTVGLDSLAQSIAIVQQSQITQAIKPLLEANKIYYQQFAQIFRNMSTMNEFVGLRLSSLVALQEVVKINVARFADIVQPLYDAKIGMFAAFESIGKLMPTIKIAQETFTVHLSSLEGQREVGQNAKVDIAIKAVQEKEGQAAVGGNIITYKERNGYVLVRRGDFELLVSSANENDGILRGIDGIKSMLGGSDDQLVDVKAQFTKVTAELTLFGKTITVSGNSYQASLCEVLFNSEAALVTEWYIDDLLTTEEFGMLEVSDDARRNWLDRIYQWARQLNMKIAIETGKKDFILVRDQKVYINPIYLS